MLKQPYKVEFTCYNNHEIYIQIDQKWRNTVPVIRNSQWQKTSAFG